MTFRRRAPGRGSSTWCISWGGKATSRGVVYTRTHSPSLQGHLASKGNQGLVSGCLSWSAGDDTRYTT